MTETISSKNIFYLQLDFWIRHDSHLFTWRGRDLWAILLGNVFGFTFQDVSWLRWAWKSSLLLSSEMTQLIVQATAMNSLVQSLNPLPLSQFSYVKNFTKSEQPVICTARRKEKIRKDHQGKIQNEPSCAGRRLLFALVQLEKMASVQWWDSEAKLRHIKKWHIISTLENWHFY